MATVTEAQVPQWKRDLIQRRKASKNPQLSSDSSQIPENDEKSLDTEKPQICQKVPVTTATCPHSDNKLESPRQQSVACNMRLEVEVPPPMESPKSLNHLPEDSIKSKILRLHKSEALNCESLRPMKTENKVMEDCESDSSEELQYGPGIVNKLKSKYLNLTLREMNKNRKIVTKFRRAASLEDLLDCEEDESKRKFVKKPQNETSDRFRNIKRGNESMKRARSVETLMRYQEEEKVIKKVNDPVNDHIVLIDRTIVKIESKLMNNERKPLNKPKRLKPLLDDTERPPQDLVKTTLKLFEGSVKKVKPKGDVAVKIATFKTINDTFKMGMKKGGKVPMVQGVKPPVQPKPLVNGNGVGFVRKIAEKLQEEKGAEVDEGVGCVSAVVSKFQMIERGSSSPCASPEPVRIKSPVPSPEPVKIKAISPEPCARVKECANVVMKVEDAGDAGDVEENGVGQLEGEKEKVRGEEEVERIVKTVQNVPEKEKKKESPKQIGIIRPLVAVKRVEGLSHRELEKNLINRVKSSEKSVVVSLKNTEDVDVGKGGDCGDGGAGSGGLWDSKPWNQQNNTMIFNFSNRKDVPDYIENDGLIIRRKKEKPKAGDSGILVLDATLDASTTDDSDWEISGGPPSPCDVSFTNDNILINGRSNISRTPRNHKHRIQFNDEATRTFEYPSEASMLEDDGTSHVDGETSTAENNDDCQLSNSNKTACSMSSTGNPTSPILGGGGLASFTPSKVDLTSEGFELGITRSLHSSACGIDQSKTSENPTKIEEIEEIEDVKSPDDSAAWGAEATADLLY